MLKDETWPAPDEWTQVFMPWERMLAKQPDCQTILGWVEKEYHGVGRYQLRGPAEDPTAGFLFYFEDPRDAEMFVLKWV